MNPREKDLGSKKEEEQDQEGFSNKFPKLPPSSSSKQWASTFKNPRIVRVSRTFGGKDRHSKVCTVRGLRDRRIRLSVPTAIQLYDLQERLGLTQPSKVIDWLLEATKHEIDKLPPLPMIPANFLQQPPSLQLPFANPNLDPNPSTVAYTVPEFLSPNLFKERERWGVGPHHDHQENHGEQNFFPLNNTSHHFSVPNLAYNPSFFHLEPQNLTLSQFGGGFSFSRSDDRESSNLSSSSRASSSQVYMADSAHFPPYFAPSLEGDHFRQINNLQSHNPTLHFSDSPMKSFSLNAALHLTEEAEEGRQEKS